MLSEPLDRSLIAHIEGVRGGLAAFRFNARADCVEPVQIAGDQYHVRPHPGDAAADGFSNAARRAGHNRNFAAESFFRHELLSSFHAEMRARAAGAGLGRKWKWPSTVYAASF